MDSKKDVQISKLLSWLLRHGATKEGIQLDDAGFANINDVLKLKQFQRYSLCDIMRVCETNDKKRFSVEQSDNGSLKIRANQGHSLKVNDDALLQFLTEDILPHLVYHGTYFSKLGDIKSKGLSRMQRNHIHFTSAFPGDSDAKAVSGVRKNCEVVIVVDAMNAQKNGIKFYKSDNSVILSPGDKDGFLPPIYIKEIYQLHPEKRIS